MKKCTILSAVCMLIILVGCTKDKENLAEEMKNQIEELQAKNAELIKEKEELELNNKNLSEKCESHENHIQELSVRNAELEENLELYSTGIETKAQIIVHKLETVLNFE